MSFIVPAPPAPEIEKRIVSGPFWPDIDPVAIRAAQRIDDTVTAQRLRGALIEAISTANGDLRTWRLGQEDAGYHKLSDVPADSVDGASVHVQRYLRAVGSLAKALIMERYRDFDATGKGDKSADALIDPIADCRRDYLHAIADIQARPRTIVELI